MQPKSVMERIEAFGSTWRTSTSRSDSPLCARAVVTNRAYSTSSTEASPHSAASARIDDERGSGEEGESSTRPEGAADEVVMPPTEEPCATSSESECHWQREGCHDRRAVRLSYEAAAAPGGITSPVTHISARER